jgi:acetyltransferase-like isoleucine patch superfamily enzyme
MANRIFGAKNLVGNTGFSLDSIPYEILSHQDVAVAQNIVDNKVYFYTFNFQSGKSTNSPYSIRPVNQTSPPYSTWDLLDVKTFDNIFTSNDCEVNVDNSTIIGSDFVISNTPYTLVMGYSAFGPASEDNIKLILNGKHGDIWLERNLTIGNNVQVGNNLTVSENLSVNGEFSSHFKKITIETDDWVFFEGLYQYTITHNLDEEYPTVTV